MHTQVVIVGAGPVGLMLAGELRLGGADAVVVERLLEPTTESRASTLHARTMEIFDQRGLLEALGTPPHDGRGHFGGISLDLTGLATAYPGQWKVPQTRLERLLAGWVADLGVEVRRGYEVESLEVTENYAQVACAGGADSLRAAYVVGCDGEDSTIRRLAGFAFPGRAADRELLRADVAGIDVPDRRFQRFPHGLAIAARRPDQVTRVMVHRFGQPPAPRTGGPSFPDVVEAWKEVTGEDISSGTPLWVNAFGDAVRLAEQYRRGRVLLAGDAAHQHMPIGGQALNLGLQDAVNLGWKLAAQVADRAPEGLLDTYHAERHEVARRVLDSVEAQALLLLGAGEVDAARAVLADLIRLPAVQDRLAATISGLDIRYGATTADPPLLGARIPHCEVDTPRGRTTIAALLRTGRGLLLQMSPATYPDARAWADRVDIVPAACAAGGPLAKAEAVLVRPDGHVAWVAGTVTTLDAALRRWFGARQERHR